MKLAIKLLALLFGALLANAALAESPREQLKQMVEQLQKTPTDNVLREKIILLAQELKPTPAVPEEARRYLARGIAAFEIAKSPEDFKLALPEFQNAANVAPWWPDTYFNLAKVQEKTGDLTGAIASYRLYLAVDPNAKDAESIRTLSYKLEFIAEQKAKEDKAKEKENDAKAAASRLAFDLVRWLQENYGGRLEGMMTCWVEAHYGCNEQDRKGLNWMSTHVDNFSKSTNLLPKNIRFTYRVFGKDNDQILLTVPYDDPNSQMYCGVLTGPSIRSVKWSYCSGHSNMNNRSPKVQFEFGRTVNGKPSIDSAAECDGDGDLCVYRKNYVLE